jgi:hypothetical protein
MRRWPLLLKGLNGKGEKEMTARKPITMKVADIKVGKRFRQDMGDIEALIQSIQQVGGLLQPLVVNDDGHLIAGRRRLEAVRQLRLQHVPVHIVHTGTDALMLLQMERDENTCRKDFTPSEAVALGKAIEDLEKPQAKKRQAEKLKKGNAPPVVENCPHGEGKGKTRDKVAEAVGMSGRTYEKAKRVVEAAEENPEEFGAVKEEMDRTGKVDPAYEKVKGGSAGTAKKKTKSDYRRDYFDNYKDNLPSLLSSLGLTTLNLTKDLGEVADAVGYLEDRDKLNVPLKRFQALREKLDLVIGELTGPVKPLPDNQPLPQTREQREQAEEERRQQRLKEEHPELAQHFLDRIWDFKTLKKHLEEIDAATWTEFDRDNPGLRQGFFAALADVAALKP